MVAAPILKLLLIFRIVLSQLLNASAVTGSVVAVTVGRSGGTSLEQDGIDSSREVFVPSTWASCNFKPGRLVNRMTAHEGQNGFQVTNVLFRYR